MKLIDILAFSSKMASLKKSKNKPIIFGLILSIVLSVILLVFSAFIITLEKSIDGEKNVSSTYFKFENNIPIYNDYDKYVEESLKYKTTTISFKTRMDGFSVGQVFSPKITIGDNEYDYDVEYEYPIGSNKIQKNTGESILLINDDKSFLKSEMKYLKENNLGDVILEGKTMLTSSNEIMVSSAFLDILNIRDYSLVIGKNISYELIFNSNYSKHYCHNGSEYIDKTAILDDFKYNWFNDFKIVGVFNSNIYKCPSRDNESKSPLLCYPNFWALGSDTVEFSYKYYETQIKDVNGNVINQLDYNIRCYDCDIKTELEKTNKIKIISYYENIRVADSNNVLLQFKNAKAAYIFTNSLINDNPSINLNSLYTNNQLLSSYFEFYPYVSFINDIILIVNIVIILLVILNIVRIQSHSLSENVKFYSLLNKMGLKLSNIFKIYTIAELIKYLIAFGLSLIFIIPIFIFANNEINYLYTKQYISFVRISIPVYEYLLILLVVFVVIAILLVFLSNVVFLIHKDKIKKNKVN